MTFTPLNLKKLSANNSQKFRLFFMLGLIVLLILVGISYYFYSQYRKTQLLLKKESTIAKDEAKYLLSMIEKLIDLPQDEAPTIATVTDKSVLPKQPFYTKAENGDKILLYEKAKRAILYRPRLNKIIEVAPLNILPTPTTTSEAIITPAGRIIFRGMSPTPNPPSSTSSAEF